MTLCLQPDIRVTDIKKDQANVNAPAESSRDQLVHWQSLRTKSLGHHADMVARPLHLPR